MHGSSDCYYTSFALEGSAESVPELGPAEDAASNAITNILDTGAQLLYNRYLDTKTFPFAAEAAENVIMSHMAMCYVDHDVPEDVESESWKLEDEPKAAGIDTWARHSLPVRYPKVVEKMQTDTKKPRMQLVQLEGPDTPVKNSQMKNRRMTEFWGDKSNKEVVLGRARQDRRAGSFVNMNNTIVSTRGRRQGISGLQAGIPHDLPRRPLSPTQGSDASGSTTQSKGTSSTEKALDDQHSFNRSTSTPREASRGL